MSARAKPNTFRSNEKGSVAIMFGGALVPLFMLVGSAVDYGRVQYVKSHMQSTLDAAVLAGGREFQITGDALVADASTRGYFDYRVGAGKGSTGAPHISSLNIDQSNYRITAEARASVPTPFLNVIGMPNVDVVIGSQSSLAIGGGNNDKDIEVSLMIDVTGSMNDSTNSGNSKIHDARLAAKDLVDILKPNGYSGSASTRIALVPFSQYVNVGAAYYTAVTDKTPSGGNTCVTERSGDHRFDDEAPTSGAYSGEYTPSSNHGNLSCAPTAEIVPLTDHKGTLLSSINTLSAAGYTAGHLGTAWAWYTLSDKWASVWPAASAPAAPGPNVLKIAVLMTDGDYNTQYHGPDSNDQAAEVCANMKASGITVYTIGFGTSLSATAQTLLQNCASSSNHYFAPEDGDKLRETFRTIALSLTDLRLTQ